MKTFYRTVVKEVAHPEFGILLNIGDRVLTSEVRTDDDGEIVVTAFGKYWIDVPASIFSEENTKVFTDS